MGRGVRTLVTVCSGTPGAATGNTPVRTEHIVLAPAHRRSRPPRQMPGSSIVRAVKQHMVVPDLWYGCMRIDRHVAYSDARARTELG